MNTKHFTSANAWHKLGSRRALRLLMLAVILLPCFAAAATPLVPFIEQISLPSVAPGSFIVLTITGGNFDPSAVARATTATGTVDLTTFVIGPTTVFAEYTAPNPAESVFITVQNNVSSVLTTSNAVPLPITNTGAVVFGDASIAVGNGPQAVALGDFNNDGKLDMAVVNSTDNTVSILLSNGDGTFNGPSGPLPAGPPPGPPTPTYKVGHNPQAIVVGDFDNDGNLDLAVANENDNSISILLGNGNGTFQTQTTISLGATNPVGPISLAAADFDYDGYLDLAVLYQSDSGCGNPSGSEGSVYVLHNKQTSPPTYPPSFSTMQSSCVGILPTAVIAGVFSGLDNAPDVVVVNEGGGNATCPPGDGTVTFISNLYLTVTTLFGPSNYCAGKGPSAAVAGDFNGDGVLDLVVTDATQSQIAFLAGNGSSIGFSFQTPATFPVGGLVPNSIIAGDFNGDGILDVAVADEGNSVVSIMQGDGTGNFTPTNGSPFSTVTTYGGRGPTSLVAADFNGDGKLDIATTDENDNFVTVLLQSPAVQLSPASLNFGNVPESSVSNPMTVTVKNTGAISARINSVTISSPFKPDATTTTCATPPFNLAGGGSCVLGVTFDPTSIGTASGTLTLATGGISIDATLVGSGIAPVVSFSPTTVTFPGTLVNTPAGSIPVSVTNPGDYAATITSISIPGSTEFTETDMGSCIGISLAAGSGSCTITVSFTPAAAGFRTATMDVYYELAGGTPILAIVPLSGDGTAPSVFLTPTPLTFSNQPVSTTSGASTVYLLNDGTAPLTISSIGVTGGNSGDFFAQNINCPMSPNTLAVSNTCMVNVTFTPSAEGLRTSSLQFTDNNNAVTGSQTVGLSGNGAGPLVSLSGGPVMFGSQQIGTTSSPATVSLSNLGTGPLTITSIGLDNTTDFNLVNNCPLTPTQIAQFGSCSVTITFTPTAAGTRTATLTFTDNNNAVTGSTQTVTITGTASASTASISTGTVAFGAVPIGTTVGPMSFMISNTGTAPLTVYSIQISPPTGEFTETNNCVGTIAIGGNCTVLVKFTPSATGLRTASLTITDNSGVCATCSTTQTVNLSGTGTDFSISVSPTSQTVSPGKVGIYTVTLTPLTGFSGSITLGCSVADVPPTKPNKTTCTVPAGTITLSGTAQKHIGVSVKPKKGTYTLTFSATYSSTPPAVGTLAHSITGTLISK